MLNYRLVDAGPWPTRRGEAPTRALPLAPPEDIVESFRATWDRLVAELDLALGSDAALEAFRDLVVYDIPDGTRSTLTVPPTMDVDLDAGMYGLALVPTPTSPGAATP